MTDLIQETMGQFGKYHVFLCFVIFLNKIPIAFHQMAIIFLSGSQQFTCPDNPTTKIPPCPCSNPVYNRSIFTSTVVSEYNLICERQYLESLVQTIFQLGTLIGSIIFGIASDKFGRKRPMQFAVILQFATGVGAAFAKNFAIFNILRFLIGISVGGTMVIGFVIIMEFCGTKHREWLSAVYQLPFCLGHLLLPVFSYFNRSYRSFQLAISLYGIILLCYLCVLPETVRWLLAMKKIDEAIEILQKVAKINKRSTENIRSKVEDHLSKASENNVKKGTLIDVFRNPNMRKNIILMSFDWLTCSYCYYGVSQYIGHLNGDIFINVSAGATIVIFGTIIAIPLLKVMGRRTITIICNFSCAICLFILAIHPLGLTSIICAIIGQVTSFIVFIVAYLYGSEMFPTVVRNAAVGFSSMMARLGAMVAPFVINLNSIADWLPPTVFGIVPLICAFTSFCLPETKGVAIMTTIEQGEQFGKQEQSVTSNLKSFSLNFRK